MHQYTNRMASNGQKKNEFCRSIKTHQVTRGLGYPVTLRSSMAEPPILTSVSVRSRVKDGGSGSRSRWCTAPARGQDAVRSREIGKHTRMRGGGGGLTLDGELSATRNLPGGRGRDASVEAGIFWLHVLEHQGQGVFIVLGGRVEMHRSVENLRRGWIWQDHLPSRGHGIVPQGQTPRHP